MIFYTGLGYLTIIVFIIPFIVIASILNWGFGIDVLAIKSWWPLHSMMVLGAVVTFVFGWYVNRKPFEEVIYEKSGPVTKLRTRHTFYWIPMQYWGLIALVVYFIFAFLRASR